MPKHPISSSFMSNSSFSNSKVIKILDEEVILLNEIRLADINITYNSKTSYNLICYCQNGQFEVELSGDKHFRVCEHQMLLMPTGKMIKGLHELAPDTKVSFVLISDRALRSALTQQIDIWNKAIYMKNIYVMENAKWYLNIMNCSRTIFYELSDNIKREISLSMLRTILLLICEELSHQDDMEFKDDSSTPHEKELFNQFLLLLRVQEVKRRNVSFYANLMNITPKYLSTISRKVSGKSPMRWITENVMQDCYCMLYETNLSMKEIADRLGFPNASCFGQFFKEQAGMTPGEYRNKNNTLVK